MPLHLDSFVPRIKAAQERKRPHERVGHREQFGRIYLVSAFADAFEYRLCHFFWLLTQKRQQRAFLLRGFAEKIRLGGNRIDPHQPQPSRFLVVISLQETVQGRFGAAIERVIRQRYHCDCRNGADKQSPPKFRIRIRLEVGKGLQGIYLSYCVGFKYLVDMLPIGIALKS